MLNEETVEAQETKRDILGIFGDDTEGTNISAFSMDVMGYRTPNIDRIAKEGARISTFSVLQEGNPGLHL